jgi:hypothetical protein
MSGSDARIAPRPHAWLLGAVAIDVAIDMAIAVVALT